MNRVLMAMISAAGALTVSCAGSAFAETKGAAATLTFEKAKAIQAKAESIIASHHIGGAVAVVDTAGRVITFDKMDGSSLANGELAPKKAFTAVAFGQPTQNWADKLAQGNTSILGNPEIVPLPGGVPIVIDGQLVGAIGVSTPQGPIDAEVANGALDGL